MGTRDFQYGAALEWVMQELGGSVVEVESTITLTAGATTLVVKGNGDRVALVIVNTSSNQAFIGMSGAMSAANGVLLDGVGANMSLTLRDDFTLPTRQFNGFSASVGTTLYIVEYIRDVRL